MATGKRFYWMKLKESFMTSDTVDYFMSQPDGANYVVLYQMLCIKTINTQGRLERSIGEIIIPYDVEKIQRDCKWFSIDTVRIALDLYKAVGLIYVEDNGTLVLANHSELVGSETDWKEQKRLQRERNQQKQLPSGEDSGQECGQVHTEIDIRDREEILDTDINKEKGRKAKATKFVPPTLEEITEYCKSRNSSVDPKYFYEYFTVGHWLDSEGKQVKNWKQKLITWEKKGAKNDTRPNPSNGRQSEGKKPDWQGLNFYSN